jgi:DNA-directed RNA polymerase subunit RPC12/RpoP
MTNEQSIRCGHCGFHLPCRTWGFFYVTDDDGNRILLEGDLESTIIADALGINEDDITGCVFAPDRNESSILLMQERVGYCSFCFCRTCHERCALDQKRDTIRCPSCGSDDVATFIGLIGTACPKCGTGTLEERAMSTGEGGKR